MDDAANGPNRKQRRKGPRRITADYLERAGLHYLQRYAASVAHFRRVLMRKVDRSARYHGDDPATGAALVDALIARYRQAGLLDDRGYAEARARSLHGRGQSARAIRGKLMQKGVAADHIDAALEAVAVEEGAGGPDRLDLRAACVFARRRRLGPYRGRPAEPGQRDKDLAALGRAGFDYDTARRVVDAESVEALEAETTLTEHPNG